VLDAGLGGDYAGHPDKVFEMLGDVLRTLGPQLAANKVGPAKTRYVETSRLYR